MEGETGQQPPHPSCIKCDAGQQDLSDTASESEKTSPTTASKMEAVMKWRNNRAAISVIVILLLSVSGCVGFLAYGILSAQNAAEENFNRRAVELVQLIESTWKEYETA